MSAIEIGPETAHILATQAKELGLSVDEYLKTLLGVAPSGAERAPDEFMTAMESLADEEDVEPLPRDFSRENIYFPE